MTCGLSRKALAALGPSPGQHFRSSRRLHPLAETVTTLANELARLVSAFHVRNSVAGSGTTTETMVSGRHRLGRTDVPGYWLGAVGGVFIPWNLATLAGGATDPSSNSVAGALSL